MSEPSSVIGHAAYTQTDPRGRKFAVHLTWSIDQDELVITEVKVICKTGGSVDTTMLRAVRLQELVDKSRPEMVKLWEAHAARPEIDSAARERVRQVLDAARPIGDNPEILELVADTYRRAALGARSGTGGRRAPTKAVHEALTAKGYNLSRQQVGKLVMRCRDPKIGLLGPAEPRRAGEKTRKRAAK